MSKEIKEILNKLLEYFKESNINDFGYEKDKLISYEEAQILLNYITNLQKENKINNDLIPCFKNREKELKKQINVLQKENERLKKKITFNEKSRRKMQQSLMEQIETYKSRNEKAVEYIYKIT